MTQRIAIIDLGSNSARLIVMHIYYNGAYNLVYNQKETVRLSEGIDEDGLLKPEAMHRAIETLKVFAHMALIFNVDITLAVATAAVRNAGNGSDFIRLAQQETGIPLRIISGEAEAKLGYLGVINTIDVSDALLFDLGGGSTELTLIKNRKAEKVISLPFGAVNLTERFKLQNKVTESQLADVTDFIYSKFKQVSWIKNLAIPLIGVGGTARNIAKMNQKRKNYPFTKVHNYRLDIDAFEDLYTNITRLTLAQRRKISGLSSERADIIVAGMSIIKCLFSLVDSSQLIVSGCGVREGMFLQYYLSQSSPSELIPDILEHSTNNMLLFYKGNSTHANHVANLAAKLFDGWQPLLELGERERTLLRVASLLHDIGITINYYDHARHSAYLVENARLFGLTHREQIIAAIAAGWHNGLSTKYVRTRVYTESLTESDWQIARKLALVLALAESLDTTQMGLIRNINAYLDADQAILNITANEPATIERQEAEKHARWFKKETNASLVII